MYILFEEGEETHHGPRIVRVGTHSGSENLRSDLSNTFY
jgi:hypothetical protein